MRIPDSKIQEISDKADAVTIIGEYVSLTNRQGRFLGLCPFHTEKTPSFNVSPDKNAYYCFGCGKGGSIFNFIMEIEKVDFIEAVKYLAEKTGVTLELTGESIKDYKIKEAKIELHNRMAGSFHHILMNADIGKNAKDYLLARGINESMLVRFELGFAPSDPRWLFRFLKKKNYSDDFLKTSGLFSKKGNGYPLFWNRIMFPITDSRKNTVGFSGRTLEKDGPKYINSPESDIYHKSSLLYGLKQSLDSIKKLESFVLCEGNIDVVALHQSGIENAIAPLGTSFTEGQAKLLKRFSTQGTIVFDGDAAGRKAAVKAGIICEKIGIDIKIATLADGMDPADLLVQKGPVFLKKQLENGVILFDFLLNYYTTQISIEQPSGKTEVIKNLKEYIDTLDSPIKKDVCFDKLSEKLNIQKKVIILEYSRIKSGRPRSVQKEIGDNSELQVDEELYLMLAVFFNRDLFSDLSQTLKDEDLDNVYAKRIFRLLSKTDNVKQTETPLLLEKIEDSRLKELIFRKSFTTEFQLNRVEVISDAVNNLKLKKLRKRAEIVNNAINKAENNRTDQQLIEELIREKNFIDKEILGLRKKTGER